MKETMQSLSNHSILANCARYYYRDLARATHFYQETLGFTLVEDFGTAKLLQVASTAFLMLVDASSGRHSADEPKTVTTAFLTDELEGWWAYLSTLDLPVQVSFDPKAGQAHDGFVVIDPEGYFLEFERFNPHPENKALMPLLDPLPSHYPTADARGSCPPTLGVKATVTWLYYRDLEAANRFWCATVGLHKVVDQGFAKVLQSSPAAFIGPVQAGDGLHPYTKEKGVTVSFFTAKVDTRFAHLQTVPAFALQHEEVILELERVRTLLGLDPEGYSVEFDEFIDHPANAKIRALLAATGAA